MAIVEQNIKVYCHTYQKNEDGSWTSILATDIADATGSIRIPPGMTFQKGRTLLGIDVAAVLDKSCVETAAKNN